MPVENAIIKSRILVFDVIRRQFGLAMNRMFLLRRGFDTANFELIAEVEKGWFAKYDDYREQLTFEIATLGENFLDMFAAASHIANGKPDADGQFDVFSVLPKDKINPNGLSPTYKCFGTRVENERFTLPL